MVARHFGSDVVLTITPDDGFCLASLIVDDTDVTRHVEDNKYIIRLVKADVTVSASFYELTTGVSSIPLHDGATVPVYDMKGRKITAAKQNGVLIVGSKKVVVP